MRGASPNAQVVLFCDSRLHVPHVLIWPLALLIACFLVELLLLCTLLEQISMETTVLTEAVKGQSSPARGYKFGCVCSYMAGVISRQRHDWPYRNEDAQICTLSLGMTAFDPTQTGLCKFGRVWSSLSLT